MRAIVVRRTGGPEVLDANEQGLKDTVQAALRACGYGAPATFGDGLAVGHRRGAGDSRSRSQDSHGQDQT